MRNRSDIAHDFTAVRCHSLRELLTAYGYDVALADTVMARFLTDRNRVEPYADVIPVLRTLGARYLLVSVTDGNVDVARTPLRGLFAYSLTVANVGARKPDPALVVGALEWSGVTPEQAPHLGNDPYRDVAVARRFGMVALWVNRAGALWPNELGLPPGELRDLGSLPSWLAGCRHAL